MSGRLILLCFLILSFWVSGAVFGLGLATQPTVMVHEPAVLIEGVLFRANYLGSTQIVCEGQPTKYTRMMQAEEAVSRIKVTFNVLINTFLSVRFVQFEIELG